MTTATSMDIHEARRLREEEDWTYEMIAEYRGVAVSTVWRWLQVKPAEQEVEVELEFTGENGATHRVIWSKGLNDGGPWLCDEWEGHGTRLIAIMDPNPEQQATPHFQAQVNAVLREYRRDASCSHRPLSRRVDGV